MNTNKSLCKKNTYIKPDIQTITMDIEICLLLNSLPPIFPNEDNTELVFRHDNNPIQFQIG